MIPLSVVDAFTDAPFGGNPAAVCILDAAKPWPSDDWLQKVGREMNLSETAFLRPSGSGEYELRWFTPAVEVALCGHATLAAAHYLWEAGRAGQDSLTFATRKSGPLAASRAAAGEIELDFPERPAVRCEPPAGLLEALGVAVAVAVGHNGDDFIVEVPSAAAVRALAPDVAALAGADCRGVIVTAPSDDPRYDFVSRFFAPRAGVNEDPVTGSAHCCLAPWWGDRLGKSELTGFQASARGGVVRVRRGGRVKLIGRAVTVTRGELLVAPA